MAKLIISNPATNPNVKGTILKGIIVVKNTTEEQIKSYLAAPTPKDNDEKIFGSIAIEEKSFALGNFVSKSKKVAFTNGELHDLVEFVEEFSLKAGDNIIEKTEQEYKILVIETTTPQFEGQTPKINPATNEILETTEGKNIYRSTHLVLSEAEEVIVGDKVYPAKNKLIQHKITVSQDSTEVKRETVETI